MAETLGAMLPPDGVFVGRVWVPGEGPCVVVVEHGEAFDMTAVAATMSGLLDGDDPAATARASAHGRSLGDVDALVANADPRSRDAGRPWALAPVDLQAIKAAGVTFASSLLERVVEEAARGSPAAAEQARAELATRIGTDLSRVRPGTPEAQALRETLTARGLWSQYLEVGLGPDPEIFTKAQPMSAVGSGAEIGLHPDSHWNNPEPEIVLLVGSTGRIVGATLGNDVNLRDVEGRSALLLGRAKDNNASAAVGPFVRLFDENYTLDHVRRAEVTLRVAGEDGFVMEGSSAMAQISRDVTELVAATIGATHQYPDGVALYLGTMFAPTKAREGGGGGFTHKPGDVVTIACPALGRLVNRVTTSDKAEPWRFGTRALLANLHGRGLGARA